MHFRYPHILILLFSVAFFSSCQDSIVLNKEGAGNLGPITFASLSNRYINANGGDKVILTGTNLISVKSILINNRPCSSLRKISTTQIECTTPSNSNVPEVVDAVIVDSAGTRTILEKQFSYTVIIGHSNSTSTGFVDRAFNSPRVLFEAPNGKVLVSDAGNSRVLIYNSFPASHAVPADLVIGQQHLASRAPNNGGVTASTVNQPVGIWSDGNRIVVADTSNHRVLLWNTFPTTNGKPADLVLGQPDFVTNTANTGPNTPDCGGAAGINACSFSTPFGVIFADNKLIVSDYNNNRLLIWDGWPTENQQPADHVIGQTSFLLGTNNNGPNTVPCGGAAGRNACSLSRPALMASHGGKLLVADSANNRILIFNTIPLAHPTPADAILGQTTALAATTLGPATGACGAAGVNACSLNQPIGVATDGTRVYVADYVNNRVLGWSSFPAGFQQAADILLGQDTFALIGANKGLTTAGQDTMNRPYSVTMQGTRVAVTDLNNSRFLIYPTLPNTGSSPAGLLGHLNFSEMGATAYGTYPDRLQFPGTVMDDGAKLYILDRINNRIIIQPSNVTSLSDTSQRITLGQQDHVSGLANNGPNTGPCGPAGRNACSLNNPLGILRVGNKIAVADYGNNRVLIWNTIPTTTGQPADLVLGQTSFTTALTNGGPLSGPCGAAGYNKCSLASPIGLASDGTNLIVAEYAGNRILIWNTFPTTSQQPADVVLGQPGFTTISANNGPNNASCDNVLGVNRCGLSQPFHLAISGTKLIVADINNNRVLIWNTIPIANQTPADVVIGFNNFTTNTALVPPTGSSFAGPVGVCVSGDGRLIVTDNRNHRTLVFNSIPTTNGATADLILGQNSASGYTSYGGGEPNAVNSNYPYGVFCKGNNVYVSDYMSSRVQIIPLLPL